MASYLFCSVLQAAAGRRPRSEGVAYGPDRRSLDPRDLGAVHQPFGTGVVPQTKAVTRKAVVWGIRPLRRLLKIAQLLELRENVGVMLSQEADDADVAEQSVHVPGRQHQIELI